MRTIGTAAVARQGELLPGLGGATHNQLIMDEDDAAATSQAILDVVSSVRSAGPLVR